MMFWGTMARFLKQLLFDSEARAKLIEGIDIVAEAVGSTLGPRGRNVAVEIYPDMDVPPTVLHDGVSVARSINLEDRFADMGARLLKDAALKTNEVAGDGTTTATVLAQAIVKEAMKHVQAGTNPMQLKRELEEALGVIKQELKKLSTEISTEVEKTQIATISAADPEIGKLVASALTKVGDDGVITVEEGNNVETTVDYKQGYEFDRGFLSPYFVNDHERSEANYEKPYILLTDKKLNYHYDIVPFLMKFTKETGKKDLVIVAGEVIEEALQTLVVNKMKGNINVVAVQAPGYGQARADMLHDIASFTGAHPILEDSGRKLDSVQVEELGRADRVIADREKTVLIGGQGKKSMVAQRQHEIREQLKLAKYEFDTVIKKERLAKLSGSVAIVNVGAVTEVEMKEKKERVIDAIAATKAAIDEGVVAGGEITLLKLASKAPVSSIGGRILSEALKSPFKKLVSNAGLDYSEALQLLGSARYPKGIDVTDGEVKDLIKAGVIDPAKVTRSALENAVSVATMILTTNVLVVDVTMSKDMSL